MKNLGGHDNTPELPMAKAAPEEVMADMVEVEAEGESNLNIVKTPMV